MYLSKESLKALYSKMASLYSGTDIESQGGTQFVSEVKYFLATDEFQKSKERVCNTQEKTDRDFFVKCVGNVVQISNPISSYSLDTKNFSQSIGQSKDFDVGSNFFSANAVKNSITSIKPLDFPTRHPRLLICDKGTICVADDAYIHFANEEAYLGRNSLKYALLFLWLNRYTNFNSVESIYTDFLTALQNRYSEALCQVLQWSTSLIRQYFEKLIKDFTFDKVCRYLEMNDVVDDEFTKTLKNLDSFLNDYVNKAKMKSFLQERGFFDKIESEATVFSNKGEQKKTSSPFSPTQIIYYGVPGCGKSHTITTMLKGEKAKDPTFSEENQVVRTTFHPEYTNADFVGQVMPKVNDGDVEYEFKAGPFAVILKRALLNPSKPFYLIIEEINRGNAAAIFGDVFQLLDRLKIGETSKEPIGSDGFENHYGKGWSEYFVMNADVNAFIRDANSEEELDTKAIDVSGIHFSSSTGLRLPPNLSIYATMNTSDQNVFTLDNAFQRRWDMELVPNTCKWDDADHKNQAQLTIGDTDIRWETFRNAINSEISSGDFFNADDKQLGLFFIEADGEKIDEKKFANKVLKYLWADVFKRNTDKIFKVKNLSEVVKDFTGTNAFDKVFAETFVQSLKDANEEIKNK